MMGLYLVASLLAWSTPASDAPGREAPVVPRPEIISASDWGSKPQAIPDSRKHAPEFVTIHHAGVTWTAKVEPEVFIRNMQSWGQRDKGWPDLPYHFLIAPDGRIFEGRPLDYEPESNTKYPLKGNIGVEMMGDFDSQRPDPRQLASCVKLTAWLRERYDIDQSRVRGHKDAASGQTSCPGKDFDRYLRDGQFHRWVQETLEGKAPEIDPGPPPARRPDRTHPDVPAGGVRRPRRRIEDSRRDSCDL